MTKFIGEIGVNHLGEKDLAFKMVKKLASSGVDAISMQVLDKKDYDNKKPWRRRIEKKFYKKVIRYLKPKKIKFGFGIYDTDAIKNHKDLNLDFWKIISYRFYNDDLINEAVKTKRKVYVSTGISSMIDIRNCKKKHPKAFFIHTTLSKNISSNILALEEMRKVLKKDVGYGLHSRFDSIISSAIALKANPIFFYAKNDDIHYYPDNEHAINVDKIKEKIKLWKFIKYSLGSGKKKRLITPSWVFE